MTPTQQVGAVLVLVSVAALAAYYTHRALNAMHDRTARGTARDRVAQHRVWVRAGAGWTCRDCRAGGLAPAATHGGLLRAHYRHAMLVECGLVERGGTAVPEPEPTIETDAILVLHRAALDLIHRRPVRTHS